MDNSAPSSILKTANQSSAGMICKIFSSILLPVLFDNGNPWRFPARTMSCKKHTAASAAVKCADLSRDGGRAVLLGCAATQPYWETMERDLAGDITAGFDGGGHGGH